MFDEIGLRMRAWRDDDGNDEDDADVDFAIHMYTYCIPYHPIHRYVYVYSFHLGELLSDSAHTSTMWANDRSRDGLDEVRRRLDAQQR